MPTRFNLPHIDIAQRQITRPYQAPERIVVVAVLREFAKNTAPGYKLSLPQHSLRRMLPALMMNVLSHPKAYTSRSS